MIFKHERKLIWLMIFCLVLRRQTFKNYFMKANSISVIAKLVNGNEIDILNEANPTDAIEQYLFPDCRPPVKTLLIKARNEDGRGMTISLSSGYVALFDTV